MIGMKMLDELNNQINAELFSSYLYLAMAADFASKNLKGFAKWMRVQASEEMGHAMKIYEFIEDRGGKVKLLAVPAPQSQWDSPLAAFQDAYAHEQEITGKIDGLVESAREEQDHACGVFLQWFVTEQVEEEANADEIVKKLEWIADSPQGLMIMDAKLGARSGSDD